MMVKITTGVPEEDQRSSFQNATLQGAGNIAFSVSTRIEVPEEVAKRGGDAVNAFVREALELAAGASPAISFEVQSGPASA
jgi:hypothetical protein